MKTPLICPKCGRREDEVKFIESFCVDDYPLNIKAPDKEELQRCKRCGRMLFRGEWTPYDEKKIEKLCDIAMDGDRGVRSAFPKFTFELGETIAKGGKVCEIVIRKSRG